MTHATIAMLLLMCLAAVGAAAAPGATLFRATMEIDFGADVGQNFGSLFEVRDEEGRVVLGAGFPGVYNTHFRSDRYRLQFFVRPRAGEESLALEPLPRPGGNASTYLFDLDGRLYARNGGIRAWPEDGERWAEPEADFSGGAMRVGSGILRFAGGVALYNDRPILDPAREGRYASFYYACGHLVFYHHKPGGEDASTSLYACPWSPERNHPIDLAEARVLRARYPGETPFAFGQLAGQIVTCSNNGGFYVFDGQAWKVLREADKAVSYQIYSMVNYYDRLVMGQYPSGHLFEYDGRTITPRKGWPPVLAGVSSSAREAQTAAIYRGDLWVGVWPWAEIWRRDADAGEWRLMGRGFSKPPLTDTVVHPYEAEIRRYNEEHGTNIVFNYWGHRVTGMVPSGEWLILSTSAKGAAERDPRLGFLTEEVYAEYGRVLRGRLPGNLTVSPGHRAGPTKLEFRVTRDRMEVLQDGKPLGSAALDPALAASLKPKEITWGYGIFGPLQGKLGSHSMTPRLKARPAPPPGAGGAGPDRSE